MYSSFLKWIIEYLYEMGRYCVFLHTIFKKQERKSLLLKNSIDNCFLLGNSAIPVTIIISIFTGSILTLQTAYNLDFPWMPKFLIGTGVREAVLLEFSSTVLCLLLAGKVGSNITSQIGSMRITEQVDALEMMGVNSASYLILPKIIAFLFFAPILYIISIFFALWGGFLTAYFYSSASAYIEGAQANFDLYSITYSLIKMEVFAFLIVSISSFYGYFVKGGTLAVGKAGTKAVVHTNVLILLSDVVLTQWLLL